MNKKWMISFFVTLALLVSMTGGAWWGYHHVKLPETEVSNSVISESLAKVEKVFELISGNYVEKVDKEKLVEGAIKGMIAELDDPYSIYMDANTSSQFEQSLDSSFQGIGAEISTVDGKITIVSPLKNSPAEKAGLKPHDQIISIDGHAIQGLSVGDVVQQIRGKRGTKVKITIQRQGLQKPIEYSVERAEIPLETVHATIKKKMDKNIGYLEITQFSEATAEDFSKKLSQLEQKKLDGLIIDVRGNPGGLLTSVEKVLSHFIPKDKPYIQIQDRNGQTDTFYTKLEKVKSYPIVVLMDKGSASAAEILAAAMSEAGGYKLIGDQSFGKGTVQQAVPLGDGSEVKMTFYKWLTPSGNWVHKQGIAPDIAVSQPNYFHLEPLHIEENLVQNQNSHEVQVMQEMLDANGYAPGRLDGYFDDQTEISVKAFQRMENINVTGEVDQKTAQKLEDNLISKIKDEKNDLQLVTALEYLAK